jgi:hypothetical protein
MTESLEELENSIDKDNIQNKPKKTSRFRELFASISNSNPDVKILDGCDSEGDIHFEVLISSLGLDYSNLLKYKSEISSDFFVNFVGEHLVRENIEKFVKVAEDLKGDYYSIVNKYEHKKFGMKIVREKFIFIFHVSLIQYILTEDFKRVK